MASSRGCRMAMTSSSITGRWAPFMMHPPSASRAPGASHANALKPDRLEPIRIPDLEFLDHPDKGDAVIDAGMVAEFVGETHAPFIVEIQKLAFADDGLGLCVVILAEEGIDPAHAGLKFRHERLAKALERRADEGWEAIEPAQILQGQYLSERRRHADAALGIELVDGGGNERLHGMCFAPPDTHATRTVLLERPNRPAAT